MQQNYVFYFSSEKVAQTKNSKVIGIASNRNQKVINPIASFYSKQKMPQMLPSLQAEFVKRYVWQIKGN